MALALPYLELICFHNLLPDTGIAAFAAFGARLCESHASLTPMHRGEGARADQPHGSGLLLTAIAVLQNTTQ
jgi:hypothetical protein